MRIELPEFALVALVGVSGSGKSTFAKTHFKPTETLSSDFFRGMISDDENNQGATPAAFEALYHVANRRLDLGLLTVIDATNVQREARAKIVQTARAQNCLAAAIVLDVSERTIRERNGNRADRKLDGRIIARQTSQLRSSVKSLRREGFRHVFVLREDEIADAEIVRVPLWNDKRNERGPFDVIGDVHGCYDELCELLAKLGYDVDSEAFTANHPGGRVAVFLGDLCDRGDKNVEVLRLVTNMAQAGNARCVAGNHDAKLLKKLNGAKVRLTHGLDKTVAQLEGQDSGFVEKTKTFLDGLISHYVFDGGNLVVAHAGLAEKYHGRSSGRVRELCIYGETSGERDEYGFAERIPWAADYRGRALVVYGHIASRDVRTVNNTVCIDTGCVFGGKLTAYRYPEKETVHADARREYYAPVKPLESDAGAGGISPDDGIPNIDDVLGERYLNTRLCPSIKINGENAAAALELSSRFAVDPRWLIYLPPTMSPCGTSKLDGYLEHPAEAFDYYRTHGVETVVCEQKHMGSRAVIVLCRDGETAARRFAGSGGDCGVVYTRTGRPFFDDAETERGILSRLQNALEASGFWNDFSTDWVCVDAELMPWSAKARALLVEQYAPTGCSGRNALALATAAIGDAIRTLGENPPCENPPREAAPDGIDLNRLLARYGEREKALRLYTDAYRRYCWDVKDIDDYRIAPFHILATEGKTWNTENHLAHLDCIKKYIAGVDPVFVATNHITVNPADEAEVARGIRWWRDLTESGGEGMVVKPLDFVARGNGKVLQPAVKCRGLEYLRIVYGPEYLLGGNLERLKKRSVGKKRGLALNEFALGMEALERFTKREPLHRVHECVFGILALESESVDPRL